MWFKVDDRFWSHPKVLQCSDSAIALWIKAGSYCAEHLTDGFVADSARNLLGFQNTSAADELVSAKLWKKISGGYQFHNWEEFQPSSKAVKEKRAADRQRKKDSNKKNSGRNPNGIAPESERPVPVPNSTSKEVRQDVSAVLDFFNASLEAREVKPKKNPPESWIRAARLMIDNDGRTVDQIQRCCEWLVTDSFWASNVLSLPKLREKYDQLRLNAQKDNAPKQQPVNDDPYFYLNKPRGGSDA